MAAKLASYLDLQEKLSIRDMFNLLEVMTVDNYNQRVWKRHMENKS